MRHDALLRQWSQKVCQSYQLSSMFKIPVFIKTNRVYSILGQFVKASCTAIQPEEFHSLTITSAPHEGYY